MSSQLYPIKYVHDTLIRQYTHYLLDNEGNKIRGYIDMVWDIYYANGDTLIRFVGEDGKQYERMRSEVLSFQELEHRNTVDFISHFINQRS